MEGVSGEVVIECVNGANLEHALINSVARNKAVKKVLQR
jgi:hypothetical protein